jgi:hypothetical protein
MSKLDRFIVLGKLVIIMKQFNLQKGEHVIYKITFIRKRA